MSKLYPRCMQTMPCSGTPAAPFITFLVVAIKPFGIYFACVVDQKGAVPEVCRLVASWIQEAGLIHFLYRSDREEAILAMLKESIRISGREGKPTDLDWEKGDAKSDETLPDPTLPERTQARIAVPEHSHVGESQSNGSSERAVQMVEDMMRTLKSALEDRLGRPVPCTAPVMRWLAQHAAFLLTTYLVGPGDLT